VFASWFCVLFEFWFMREAAQGSPLVTSLKVFFIFFKAIALYFFVCLNFGSWKRIHVYKYVCEKHIHKYVYTCIQICIYKYVCMYVCIQICMYACMYACIYVCMYVYTYICVDTNMCIDTKMYACITYVCMYIRIYECMYVYTQEEGAPIC